MPNEAVTRIAVPSNSTARSAIDERSRSASSVAPASGVCGSKIWSGEIETIDGRTEVKVTDHRHNICDQSFPLIIVELKDANSGTISTLYTPERG